MRRFPDRIAALPTVAAAVLVFLLAASIGGAEFGGDVGTIYRLAMERAARPGLTIAAIMVTQLGGVQGLAAILLLALALLAADRRWRDAIALAGIVLGGRILIEVLKLAIDRPRPAFGPHPVDVFSLSFPSGHAGNSMITFLAIAMIAAPERIRGRAVFVASAASVVVGATRPFLGVHWPSDVVGGWALGAGWVVALAALTRRWRGAAK